MSSKTTPAYLTAKQIAKRFNVSIATIWRWSRTRPDFPPPKQLGVNCTRWRLSDLLEWEETQQEDSK